MTTTPCYFGRTLLWGAALGLLLTACGPSYYLTVQPSEAAGAAGAEHQPLFAELDSVKMVFSFSHHRDKEVLFDAEVRNGSGRPILVDPAQFYYEPGISQTVASTTVGASFFLSCVPAVDPEQTVQSLAAKLGTEDRKATGTSGWEWLTIASDLTADLTANKRKETEQEKYDRKVQYAQSMQGYADNRVRHAEAADRTAMELELWQHQMLRRYLLQPGELVRGYVVFPALDQTVLLRLRTPVGPHQFTFDFDQQRRKY